MATPSLFLNFKYLQLLIFLFASRAFAIRKDTSFLETQICRTTVQGRYLITDHTGYVCDALSLDPKSHCCRLKRDQYSCQGCNLVSQCCNSYEYCVSCCLNPQRTQIDQATRVKIAKPVTSGTYSTLFDYCAGRCRHNSESVVHENAYLSEFHHCFAPPSNNSVGITDSQIEVRLLGINVIVGKQGESCDSVCKAVGQSCVGSKFALINQCEIMQKYMKCRGSCLANLHCFLVMDLISIQGDFAPVLKIHFLHDD
ncbi:unnamed protein product [Lactuca virosa]|uniref:SREBP regulating gene protein n=1 Tax=Lactuca virosa TaxID=75947 RepID=A0AAU9MH42_9ASTR|nr:unnamed protein product [Lactuca virosa]